MKGGGKGPHKGKMNDAKILVVDDEKKLVKLVKAYLEKEGYYVVTAYDGDTALELFESESPDLVVLDIMLPGIDGLAFCSTVRARSRTPIIMLSARSEETDRVIGLELGADDYVTKPFSPRELVARVRAVLRRTIVTEEVRREPVMTRGPMLVDPAMHMVTVDGNELPLTSTEFAILISIARRPGQVFSRSQLLSLAQGEYYEGYERTVDTHIKNIRKKLNEKADEWEFIETVHGVGYRFKAKKKA